MPSITEPPLFGDELLGGVIIAADLHKTQSDDGLFFVVVVRRYADAYATARVQRGWRELKDGGGGRVEGWNYDRVRAHETLLDAATRYDKERKK